jgi:hypothetical protein
MAGSSLLLVNQTAAKIETKHPMLSGFYTSKENNIISFSPLLTAYSFLLPVDNFLVILFFALF